MLPLAVWADEQHPLAPVDNSSPRVVLEGFMSDMDKGWSVIYRSYGEATRDSVPEVMILADRILRRLDLSDVAPTARVEEGYDSASHLYETLNRLDLPALAEIPGADAFPPGTGAAEWRIPHTEIVIARRPDSDRPDEFLFTRDTVARANGFYARVKHLPYSRDVPVENIIRLRETEGGWMIPRSFTKSLPAPLLSIVMGQAVWKLIAFALMLILVVFLMLALQRLTRPSESASQVRFYLSRIVPPAVLLALLPGVVYLTTEQINIVGDFAQGVRFAADIVSIIAGTWVVWLACLALAEIVISTPRIQTSSLNAQLLRLTGRVAGIVFGLMVVFIGANRIGLPLLGVLAGVGVGGLAIALAAQDSLKNLLGSLMIFMDQPYKPGQRIIVEGQDGFVEQIGLRSTRIRQMGGSLITIPNEKMARLDVENIGERTFMRRVINIRIPINTPPDKMERALEIISEILKDHEGMKPELPARTYFTDINPDSLNIFVMYWFHPPKRWKFFEFNQWVNLEILKRFAAEGIDFAYPTTTTRLVGDGGFPDASMPAQKG
jgi:MscS family membrane protein